MEKPKLSIWGIVENASWDSIKYIWKALAPKSFGAYMAGIGAAMWQWASSSPATTIAVVACLFVIGYERWDALKDRRRQRQDSSLSLKLTPGDLVIHYAGYGLEFGKYRDVTKRVKSFADNDKLHMRVDEKSLQCDPYPGQIKNLLVIYSHGTGEGLKAEVSDGQLIHIP